MSEGNYERAQDDIITDTRILREVSADTTMEEVEKIGLIPLLNEALKKAWCPAVGLAAIQIGIPLKFAVHYIHWKDGGEGYELKPDSPIYLLNAKIVKAFNLQPFPKEGCLSMPNQRVSTWRYTDLIYTNVENGKEVTKTAVGFEAVVVQHEIGHFNGELCIDKVRKPEPPGRNDPCHCASGVKFKKCCEGKPAQRLTKIVPQKAEVKNG